MSKYIKEIDPEVSSAVENEILRQEEKTWN